MRLGYLVFTSPNSCSCEVLEEAPEGVTVDLEKGTWEHSNEFNHRKSEKVGGRCYLGQRHDGIIGVYRLDGIKQISQMVRDAVYVQEDWSDAD